VKTTKVAQFLFCHRRGEACESAQAKQEEGGVGGDMTSIVVELVRKDALSPNVHALPASAVQVINVRLLQEAIARACKAVFVIFSGQGAAGDYVLTRSDMPRLYDELWDLALESGKLHLDCVVIPGSIALEDFLKNPRGKEVDLVVNAGREIDQKATSGPSVCSSSATVQSIGNSLQEEAFGVPYVLYNNQEDQIGTFEKLAVGGTFDHFHNGHKKLLTICMTVCTKELIVGVTDDSMLGSKKFKDQMESIDQRKAHVTNFLQMMGPAGLTTNIVVIKDVWGPTVVDPDIEGLVVSTETLKGARMINDERQKRGMKPLQVIAVSRAHVYTLSSTFVRRWASEKPNL